MREIKLMGWDGEHMMGPFFVGSEMSMMRFEALREYTGLKDSKRTEEYPEGQEIYEGDVLERSGFRRLVEWENGGFWADGETWGYGLAVDPLYHYLDGCGSHVIGNKYENSELLEAK